MNFKSVLLLLAEPIQKYKNKKTFHWRDIDSKDHISSQDLCFRHESRELYISVFIFSSSQFEAINIFLIVLSGENLQVICVLKTV